jgi:hypothetical protein
MGCEGLDALKAFIIEQNTINDKRAIGLGEIADVPANLLSSPHSSLVC